LVRRVLRTAGGPCSRCRPGPASTPHAWPGGAGGGPCGGAEHRRLDTDQNNSATDGMRHQRKVDSSGMSESRTHESSEFLSKSLRVIEWLENALTKVAGLGLFLLIASALLAQLAAWAAGLNIESLPDDISKYPGNLRYVAYVGVVGMGSTIASIFLMVPVLLLALPLRRKEQKRVALLDKEAIFQEKVVKIGLALNDAKKLVDQLEQEIAVELKALEKLQKEKEVLGTNEFERKAIMDMMQDAARIEFESKSRKDLKTQVVLFVAGLAMSVPLGFVVNFLSRG
jgi:hypothetical protein